ncbi:MAG: DinB family protein [Gemmatimonadota bacterium]
MTTPDPFKLYTATLFDALGSRNPLEVMRGTPTALRHAVSGLSPAQLAQREAPGKWSPAMVVQHLADAELVGGFRFRMVLAQDSPTLPGYDQDAWADRMRYDLADLEASLTTFSAIRAANLRLLERATPAELARYMVHSERGNESLEFMLRIYGGHDLIHLRQISRIRQAIGARG